MKREKINKLYILLKEEAAKAQKAANEARAAANEIAKSSYNSPSQSGDRFHSQGQADIAIEMAARLSGALKRVGEELTRKAPEEITPICFVNLEYDDGTKDGLYYLEEPLSIAGNKFVSSNSPFGVALAGKKVGESFIFESSDIKRSGKITSIT